MKNIEIVGGGTVSHVRNHLALCAPAYGTTARRLGEMCAHLAAHESYEIFVHYTKMAGGKEGLETNEDISKLVDKLVADPETKIIFFNPALCDYDGFIYRSGAVGYEWSDCIPTDSGKYADRLQTSNGDQEMLLRPAHKIIRKIRKERKDIFLVAFKTTCGATEDEQFLAGLKLLKDNSCNLVLANDTKTRINMIITPEQTRYSVTMDRDVVLSELVRMALSRAKGTFTHSKVIEGFSVPWDSPDVPKSLRTVVDHCIAKGAYKLFQGSTVGHFAFKVSDSTFVTSKRKSNFNKLNETGMVLCSSEGKDDIIAYGAKPSVGGQSQRIIFKEHPDMDCILHFHCPYKPGADLSIRSQFTHECGSHECGKNTSDGLREEVPGVKCVYLDNHGPNIVFNRNIDPQKVIDFITRNFYLSDSTDQVDRSKTEVV